jgi:hypothetical protein
MSEHPTTRTTSGEVSTAVRLDQGHIVGTGGLPERFPNPGLPPHVPRMSDLDEKAARRAERQVATLFGLSAVAAVVFVVAYFAIDSGLIASKPPPNGIPFFYYALIAFLAGFSERFAHVILGKADLTVARSAAEADALAGTPSADSPAGGLAAAAGTDARTNGRTSFRPPVGADRTKGAQ